LLLIESIQITCKLYANRNNWQNPVRFVNFVMKEFQYLQRIEHLVIMWSPNWLTRTEKMASY